jgi:hypothetical protein
MSFPGAEIGSLKNMLTHEQAVAEAAAQAAQKLNIMTGATNNLGASAGGDRAAWRKAVCPDGTKASRSLVRSIR